nr:hypothetical protein CFP56_36538 [Quercus suber]
MLHGYAMVLIGELWALRAYIPPSPHMSGRGPIIPLGEIEYMLASLGPMGSWGSFAQALWPLQDPKYTPGTLGEAGPSTGPLAGDASWCTYETMLLVRTILETAFEKADVWL